MSLGTAIFALKCLHELSLFNYVYAVTVIYFRWLGFIP